MQLLPLLPGGRVTPPQCGALRQQCPPLLLHAAPILTGRMHARTNTHMHTHMLLPHQPEACVYRRCIGPCVQKFPCPVYHVRYVHKYICVHARKLCAHGWYIMYAMQICTHVCMQGNYVHMVLANPNYEFQSTQQGANICDTPPPSCSTYLVKQLARAHMLKTQLTHNCKHTQAHTHTCSNTLFCYPSSNILHLLKPDAHTITSCSYTSND